MCVRLEFVVWCPAGPPRAPDALLRTRHGQYIPGSFFQCLLTFGHIRSLAPHDGSCQPLPGQQERVPETGRLSTASAWPLGFPQGDRGSLLVHCPFPAHCRLWGHGLLCTNGRQSSEEPCTHQPGSVLAPMERAHEGAERRRVHEVTFVKFTAKCLAPRKAAFRPCFPIAALPARTRELPHTRQGLREHLLKGW